MVQRNLQEAGQVVSLLESVLSMKFKTLPITAVIALSAVILWMLMTTVFVAKPTEQLARLAVENYAKIEFELGDPERRQMVIKFSPKREAELRKESQKEWVYVTFGYHDRIIVSSYKLGDIHLNGMRATAKLHYRRLAHAEGNTDNSWKIVSEPAHDETVVLNLVFDKGWRPSNASFVSTVRNFLSEGQWWVLDPPSPRVSKQKMLAYYEAKIKEYSSTWKQDLSDPRYNEEQKKNVRLIRDMAVRNLRVLNSLP